MVWYWACSWLIISLYFLQDILQVNVTNKRIVEIVTCYSGVYMCMNAHSHTPRNALVLLMYISIHESTCYHITDCSLVCYNGADTYEHISTHT